MAITGAAQNQIGLPVFASADGTLTMTSASGNQRVGVLVDYISSGVGVVLLTPFFFLSAVATDAATTIAALEAAGLMNK